jgi:hypothetical protein
VYPVARRRLAWLPPALMGVAAAVGFGCTLLPLWTITLDSKDLEAGLAEAGVRWENSDVVLKIGFYDWGIVTSSATVVALIPIALAVTFAIAVTLAVRGADRALWAAAAMTTVCTLALSAATALQPAPSREVTGPLARRLSLDDLDTGGGFDVGYGAGLIVALVAMAAVFGIAVWQYIALRPKALPAYPYPA